ncbi:GNAT family N-acetyltransferase [Variovorax sp. RKNM96]|uniref:GNAT family N-acetyltransferase n=1 Tax=Variovorax sp. RKNM96 TaxID=2681552 RepID=UPI00197D9E68|nr:GNAT family protein [Variovorax sp. RKNM96]QSI34326.1 GNAT family N-acetyltransferase [Variovorax sp. RKNM96]
MTNANAADVPAERFPSLATPRLTLREIAPTDAASLLAIHGDREAMRWFGSDPITSLPEAEQMVQTFASLRKPPVLGIRWAIERNQDRRHIGTCGLFRWNRNWKSCSVGYELARDTWGNGLMTEAVGAALTWGFESMALNRIEAQAHPENAASLKLLQRLGFVEEGRQRQAGFWCGEHHDLVQLSLLRYEYSNGRKQ